MLAGAGRRVKLEIAKNSDLVRTQLAEVRRVGISLCQYGGQRAVGGPRQRRHAQRFLQRLLRQTAVDQDHRHGATLRFGQQVRPDFGFHQQAQAWLEVVEKPRHRSRAVPRLPDLHVASLQQRSPLGAAGGRAVREQNAQAGVCFAQGFQQHSRRARFAQ